MPLNTASKTVSPADIGTIPSAGTDAREWFDGVVEAYPAWTTVPEIREQHGVHGGGWKALQQIAERGVLRKRDPLYRNVEYRLVDDVAEAMGVAG
jgi:hypothetical protein